MTKIIISLLLCLLPVSLPAQVNPLDGDNGAIRVGRALFGARCSGCHGADAKGIVAPDLTALWANGVNDARVFDVIRTGVPGSVMPPSQSPDTELWSIVAWLKSVSTVPAPVLAGGDTVRGGQLFRTHCAQCHRINGDGGSLGPDLTRISRIRSRDDIAIAIRQPDALVARRYRTVQLVTRDGEIVEGLLKAEDAFSIQVLDRTQRLRGFRTAELSEVVREPGSLMPGFDETQLDDTAINDLLDYLTTALSPNNSRGIAP